MKTKFNPNYNVVEAFRAFAGSYSVANIQNWSGLEGPGFTADFYCGSRKICSVENRGDGGPVFYRGISKEDMSDLLDHIKKVGIDQAFEPEDMFIATLLDWRDILCRMRSDARNGALVAIDFDHVTARSMMPTEYVRIKKIASPSPMWLEVWKRKFPQYLVVTNQVA